MANLLDAAIPRILSKGLKILRENTVMPRLVTRNFDKSAMEKGKSVDVPIAASMGEADDVIPSANNVASADIAPRFVSIKLDKWKQKSFTLTDKELMEVMDGYDNLQMGEAARSIARSIDRDLFRLYQAVPNVVGTPGLTPFAQISGAAPYPTYMGLGAVREARRVLNKNLADDSNRYIVLDPDAEANATMLAQFTSAADAGTDATIKRGVIGEKFGFDWFMSQNVPSHTVGIAGTLTTNGATNLLNSPTLAISGATAAPNPGDVFTIAGDPLPYSALTGSTATVIQVSPPLRRDFATGAVATIVTTGTAVQNMIFHRDAFALAVRPIADIGGGLGNKIETFTDDVSGLTMRLEISRQNKQTQFCYDVLYGVAALRPELAVRLAG